jgi:2-C-methyl-D-erythritol 2,4-cyclodiphosphate synthase
VTGRRLFLGGVEIEHGKGLLGNSDADALIHAISDAIFGALCLPNIGEQFPETADWTKDLDSKKILKRAADVVAEGGYTVSNVDAVIVAQEPKLSPHFQRMRDSIAGILVIPPDCVGLKATTSELIGTIGHGEAIAVMANVLLLSAKE